MEMSHGNEEGVVFLGGAQGLEGVDLAAQGAGRYCVGPQFEKPEPIPLWTGEV